MLKEKSYKFLDLKNDFYGVPKNVLELVMRKKGISDVFRICVFIFYFCTCDKCCD